MAQPGREQWLESFVPSRSGFGGVGVGGEGEDDLFRLTEQCIKRAG